MALIFGSPEADAILSRDRDLERYGTLDLGYCEHCGIKCPVDSLKDPRRHGIDSGEIAVCPDCLDELYWLWETTTEDLDEEGMDLRYP